MSKSKIKSSCFLTAIKIGAIKQSPVNSSIRAFLYHFLHFIVNLCFNTYREMSAFFLNRVQCKFNFHCNILFVDTPFQSKRFLNFPVDFFYKLVCSHFYIKKTS